MVCYSPVCRGASSGRCGSVTPPPDEAAVQSLSRATVISRGLGRFDL